MKVHVGKTLFGSAYTVRLEAQALASTIRKSVHRSGTKKGNYILDNGTEPK